MRKPITLNPEQSNIVSYLTGSFLDDPNPYYTITGEGGTGKTTCIMTAINYWAGEGRAILVTAPTNKAVKQLQKAANEQGIRQDNVTFCTVAKALGLALLPTSEQKSVQQKGAPLIPNYKVMVMDEGSMVSRYALHDYLLPALHNAGIKLITMGDALQLPPVKESKSEALLLSPANNLTKVERFRDNSGIAALTTYVRSCRDSHSPIVFDAADYTQFDDITVVKPVDFLTTVVSEFDKDTDLSDNRVLAWTNARVDELNEAIREKIYGKNRNTFEVGEMVVTGAPVVDLSTGEIVCNTDDELIVEAVTTSSVMDEKSGKEYKAYLLTLSPTQHDGVSFHAHVIHKESYAEHQADLEEMKKRAKDNPKLWFRYHQIRELSSDISYCYCITVHRSQGSTYKNVYVDVNNIMRNWVKNEVNALLYVAFSRASERLIIGKTKFRT